MSVLKSHFAPASIGDSDCHGKPSKLEQLLSKTWSEKRFVFTHWLQEGLGLSEVLWGTVREDCFVCCGVRFQRFKKGSRALATRAKTKCLDQNRQSLGYIARRSNHWAKATNLTYTLSKQCVFYSWNTKCKIAFQELLVWAHLQLTLLALSKVTKARIQARMELVCTVLIYHSVKKSFKHMFYCNNTSSIGAVGTYSQ